MPPKQMAFVWIDGKISRAESPVLPALDQAYLSGMGLFETIKAAGGVPLFLDAHFSRLADSAAFFGLKIPEVGIVRRGMIELLERQGLESARIRLTISGEVGRDGVPFCFGGKTRTTLLAFPVKKAGVSPVRLATAPFRLDSTSPLAGKKCTSYALQALAVQHARAAGCDDALMLNHRGDLVGAATGNLFWVKGGEVHTPDTRCGCRDGVTRERVIRACERLRIPFAATRAKAEVLADADEVFTTSAIRGLRSVIALDGIQFHVGVMAKRIRESLNREAQAESRRS
jgi:branched-chain amino acid aminotransferase